MSMGKKQLFIKLRKWSVFLGILIVFIVGTRPGKEGEENFFRLGKEIIKESITKQMIYGGSVIWGLAWEEESFPGKTPEVKTESALDFKMRYQTVLSGEELEEWVKKENETAALATKEEFYFTEKTEFEPQTRKQREYNMEDYKELEAFVKQFYTVDPTTAADASFLNAESLASYDCTIERKAAGPQILIYHTHSQESFADSEPGKEEDTIVGAGELLSTYLEEYGFLVYHHTGKYDVENRDYAYSNALPEIEKLLEENPQIQVVIDLHRDAVEETTRLVTDIQGRQTAKVMFFNGLGRTREKGEISYLKNPYLKENLAFSFQMKKACDEYYPGFARNIYLRAYRYNMHLCPKTLLIELGAQTNTKEEIFAALKPLAHVLSLVLSGEEKN